MDLFLLLNLAQSMNRDLEVKYPCEHNGYLYVRIGEKSFFLREGNQYEMIELFACMKHHILGTYTDVLQDIK